MSAFYIEWVAEQRRRQAILNLRYRVVARDERAGEPAFIRLIRKIVTGV